MYERQISNDLFTKCTNLPISRVPRFCSLRLPAQLSACLTSSTAMESTKQHSFHRARFDPLGRNLARDDNIRSLPDLINFNAEVNPHHLFCVQASARSNVNSGNAEDAGYGATQISFRTLKQAVDACSSWLGNSLLPPAGQERSRVAPVALYLESDVGLFIYIAALLSLGVPVSIIVGQC